MLRNLDIFLSGWQKMSIFVFAWPGARSPAFDYKEWNRYSQNYGKIQS